MDNTTLLFNAIQRTYRNAIVELIRVTFSLQFGDRAIEEVKTPFGSKDENGRTQWENIKSAAHERRSGGTGELSTPIRDEFELLGVERFFNVFEKYFEHLCPTHSQKPPKEKAQAKQTLTGWMKQIKNIRDPVSHPVTDDISYDDSVQVLYCARKTLDFCGLPTASQQIIRQQSKLLGGITQEAEKTFTALPPADEVVMDFVGRHSELAVLNDWLSANTSHRWALSGEGGKGKSAIAYAFAKSVASRDDHGLEAVLWMSAKRRRFVEGTTILVDRPDFHDQQSAVEAILRFYAEPTDGDDPIARALGLLTDFPSLLVVDDIDTVEGEGEDAIRFLVMTIPERTRSKVLITSRRALFAMANLTTQIQGLTPNDAEQFIKIRCDWMGIDISEAMAAKEKMLEVTDSSPLFLEDLLRLAQTGIGIERAIGLWAEKRGTEARKYAIQREYDQLDGDAKQVLLALTIQGPCSADDVMRGLDWQSERLADAMQQLRKMFLVPTTKASVNVQWLALNRNIQILVSEVFRDSENYRRTERTMKAAAGKLRTKRPENENVARILSRARLLSSQYRVAEAEVEVQAALTKYPGRADVHATIAWLQKKNNDFASARMNFNRAHELGCNERDAYWHWADLEAANDEWTASASAAELGIQKFGDEQGLLFRLGYALHRQGRELILEGDSSAGTKLCGKAQEKLERARDIQNSEARNYTLRNQIYRAIALNLEALGDGGILARHFAQWQRECPNDHNCETEYQRLRLQFSQFLRAH